MWAYVRYGFVFAFMTVVLSACNESPEVDTQEAEQSVEPELAALAGENEVRLFSGDLLEEEDIHARVVTNIDQRFRTHDNIVILPTNTPVYDIAFVRYSEKFAKTYGYPDSHIAEMTDGVHLFEFTMKTVGRGALCDYNLLIEKNADILLPDKNYIRELALAGRVPFQLPNRLPDEEGQTRMLHRELIDKWSIDSRYVYDKFHMSNTKYIPRSGKSGNRYSLFLNRYMSDLYPDLDFISLLGGCGAIMTRLLERGEAYIWITRRDAVEAKNAEPEREEFYQLYKVPDEVVNFVRRATEGYQGESSSYQETLAGYYGR